MGEEKLGLSQRQLGMFIEETKAKTIREYHIEALEESKIDVEMELQSVRMKEKETVNDYITRGREIAAKSAASGQVTSERKLTHHLVRGLNQRFERKAEILKEQKDLNIENLARSLKKEEYEKDVRKTNHVECVYKARSGKILKKCYHYVKIGHIKRDCFELKSSFPKIQFFLVTQ